MRILWTAGRSNQSILKENNPEVIGRTHAKIEALILWPPDVKIDSLKKTLMLGRIEGKRRRGWQTMRWLDSITDSMEMNLSKLQERVKDMENWHSAVRGVTKSQT